MQEKAQLNVSTPLSPLRRFLPYRRCSAHRQLPPQRLVSPHPCLGYVSGLRAHPICFCRSYLPFAAASSASPSPSVFGLPAANSTGSATAKQPAKQPAEKQKSAENSLTESEDTHRPNGTKASPFAFSSAFGGGHPAPPTTTPFVDLAKQELIRDTLANLAKLGYAGLTEVDLGKLNPPDIYEEELEVMAEVRAYFQVAYKVGLRGADTGLFELTYNRGTSFL